MQQIQLFFFIIISFDLVCRLKTFKKKMSVNLLSSVLFLFSVYRIDHNNNTYRDTGMSTVVAAPLCVLWLCCTLQLLPCTICTCVHIDYIIIYSTMRIYWWGFFVYNTLHFASTLTSIILYWCNCGENLAQWLTVTECNGSVQEANYARTLQRSPLTEAPGAGEEATLMCVTLLISSLGDVHYIIPADNWVIDS